MIALVQGPIVEKSATGVVIDANGVGYELAVPTSVLARLGEIGAPARLRTHLDVKDDSLTLYGFLERTELDLFRLILGVSGIGPKIALAILSGMTPPQVYDAIGREDTAAFGRVKGVGKKTAAKLIFELRSKLGELPSFPHAPQPEGAPAGVWSEVSEALRSLGYKETEIRESLAWVGREAGADGLDVTHLLRRALVFFQQPGR